MPTLHLLLAAFVFAGQHDTMPVGYTPHRVYDSQHKRWSDFESMAAELAKMDVIFLGEQHDDASTHRMEAALLDAIARRRGNIVVSLEMFERDVQPLLDDYLAGRIDEATFLKASRPWPNYATDYRPLVEFAKARGYRVIAANIPRKMASSASSKGIEAVAGLTDSTRGWAAAEFSCPKDHYFARFGESMKEHPLGPGPAPTAEELAKLTERFYQSQCSKDETMAESIAWVSRTPGRTQVLNFYLVNDRFYFVDLPGYGYAAVPSRVRETWGPMIEGYLKGRPTLRGVVLLLDGRHPPQAHDVATRAWLAQERIGHLLVLTKIDKVPRGKRAAHLREAAACLGLSDPGLLLPVSAVTGEGEAALWKALEVALAPAREGR